MALPAGVQLTRVWRRTILWTDPPRVEDWICYRNVVEMADGTMYAGNEMVKLLSDCDDEVKRIAETIPVVTSAELGIDGVGIDVASINFDESKKA